MSLPPLLPKSPRRRQGTPGSRPPAFTLVELLVSITILTVLVGVLFQVFSASATGWQRAESRADAFREARAALGLITRDLSQTIAPTLFTPTTPANSPLQPLYPTLVLDRYPGNDTDIATKDNDPFEQVHCLTLVPNATPSALSAVSYFCRWDDTKKTYTLARRVVNSTNTFNRFKTATNAHTTTTGTPPTSTFSSPLAFLDLLARSAASDDPKTADQSKNTPDANDLAAYVWDLQFRVDTNLQVTPTAAGSAQTPAADHAIPARTYALDAPYPNALPPYVEVRFKALSANAGARLRGTATRQTWTDPSTPLYRTVILPSSQQFVQRVPLNNVPAPTTN